MSYTIKDVDQAAKDLGGDCTWSFSQSFASYDITSIAGSGICLSLSIEWIGWCLNNQRLCDHLGGIMKGHSWISPNLDYLQRISLNQKKFYATGRDGVKEAEKHLAYKFKVTAPPFQPKDAGRNLHDITDALATPTNRCGLMIFESSDPNVTGAHGIAVYVGEGNYAIFDPNFGEYWFWEKDPFFFFCHGVLNMCYRPEFGYDEFSLLKYKLSA
ncbi:MAG: hypothetical protein KTR17_02575 [Cellvibrionaceae bacterium]|nr:hypothetical protein [Cellvibrionaceae bacterium]